MGMDLTNYVVFGVEVSGEVLWDAGYDYEELDDLCEDCGYIQLGYLDIDITESNFIIYSEIYSTTEWEKPIELNSEKMFFRENTIGLTDKELAVIKVCDALKLPDNYVFNWYSGASYG